MSAFDPESRKPRPSEEDRGSGVLLCYRGSGVNQAAGVPVPPVVFSAPSTLVSEATALLGDRTVVHGAQSCAPICAEVAAPNAVHVTVLSTSSAV